MKNIVLSAENTREAVSRMNTGGSFDRKSLLDESHKATDFRQTRLYGTIPVVAAWNAIQKVADSEGYEFRVPSFNPRNPKNKPDADEERILNKLAEGNLSEYFEIDPERNLVVYARPIHLSADCLSCHGNPIGRTEGKDILGFRMEGWQVGESHGAFLLRAKMDPIDNQVRAGMWSAALWLTPISIVIGVCAYLFTRKIRTPLVEAVHAMQAIAGGNLTAEIKTISNDETGDMADAMRAMSAGLRNMVRDLTSSMHSLSSLSTTLSSNSSHMADGSRSVSDRAHSVAAAAEQMSANVTSVASGMEQTTNNLSFVATHTAQMTATIGEIAANSERARHITVDARDQAARITQQMGQLGEAAQQIGKVTETISEISAQTNLLALNATIEAARAGTAGKGFAVVATEIKALAQQTAAATEDIKQRIEGVQSSTSAGISEIERISRVIDEVSHIVSTIAAAIEEQATVTKDIAANIAEATAGVKEANARVSESSVATRDIATEIVVVDRAAGDMVSGSEQVRLSAAELSNVADQLSVAMQRFQV
jgi:methyl-accepting chemotaxis protein